ncbi:MAG: sensor histidine kinase [Eubacteriales bacterium]|nr:sensor histidine kinase [Eubacteriales bacterium]
MKHLWRKMGLIQRITLMITCILIVPTALVCTVYYQNYRNSLLLEVEDTLQSRLGTMTSTMDGVLRDVETIFDGLDYSQELFYFLQKNGPSDNEQCTKFLKGIQEEWIDIRYAYPNQFSQMTLYSSNTEWGDESSWKFYIRSLEDAEGLPTDGTETICYTKPQQVEEQQDGFTKVRAPNSVLPAWLVIRDFRTDQPVGAVELDIPLEKLIGDRVLREIDSNTLFFLLDEQGEILYETEAMTEDAFRQVSFSQEKQVQEWTLDGTVYLAISSRCSKTNLIRVAMVPKRSVTKAAQSMLMPVGLVALAGIVCMMLLIYWTIRQLLNRLMELDSVIMQVKTGDFNAMVRKDDYDDEISHIKNRFNSMTARLQELIRKTVEQEKAQKDAELKALQAQINPHFLFNTLESMRMQCAIDSYYKIENGLASLGDLLHYTLRWEHNEVPFAQEWNYLKNYIVIMAIRLDEDFSYEMTCPPEVENVVVPKMILQPLVENSFQHGFRDVPPPWHLEVCAREEGNRLVVSIRDNGGGMTPERLEEIQSCLEQQVQPTQGKETSHSIGLANVVQRIEHMCKPGSGVKVGNRSDQRGAEITLTIIQ